MTDRNLIEQDQGLSLMEIVVAMFAACVFGLAAAQQAVQAHRAERTGVYWIKATQLATAQMGLLRAGHRSQEDITSGGFDYRSSVRPASGYADLELAEVTVTWEDRGEKTFTLTALIPGDK